MEHKTKFLPHELISSLSCTYLKCKIYTYACYIFLDASSLGCILILMAFVLAILHVILKCDKQVSKKVF